MEFANIVLLSKEDSSVVIGGMSELNGSFEFTSSPGQFILRAGFIGFESYYRDIELGKKSNVNVGTIQLSGNTESLDEVLVEGVSSMFESDIF